MRPVLAAVALLGLASTARAAEVRDIPYYMRSPQERASTLRVCRNDHRFDRLPECANASSAEDALWRMRARLDPASAVQGLEASFTPSYLAAHRLARRGMIASCRAHPGLTFSAQHCANAEIAEGMDPGAR